MIFEFVECPECGTSEQPDEITETKSPILRELIGIDYDCVVCGAHVSYDYD